MILLTTSCWIVGVSHALVVSPSYHHHRAGNVRARGWLASTVAATDVASPTTKRRRKKSKNRTKKNSNKAQKASSILDQHTKESSVTISPSLSHSGVPTLPTEERLIKHHFQDYFDDDGDDDAWLYDDNDLDLTYFQQLQDSTGSEVLDADMQQQVDSVEEFRRVQMQDASHLEQIAMSSLPEQLPRPAVKALTAGKKNKTNKGKWLQFSNVARLSHEQELELAKSIQQGVALHKLKTDYESQHERDITRQEWAELAKLSSTKELRHSVLKYRHAKHLLVSANIGLVHAVVSQQAAQSLDTNKDELLQEASLGLLRAAELFDPNRGIRFSTYATIWIKGMLQNNSKNIQSVITIPQREKTKWNKIKQAQYELQQEQNSLHDVSVPVPMEQVAARVGMPVQDVLAIQRRMTQAQRVLSLDYEYETQSRSGSDPGRASSLLEQDKAVQADVDLAERVQLQADVVAALARHLTPREARLMRLRYGLHNSGEEPRSLKQCAEAMGLSQTRVQQMATKCLKTLRDAAELQSLEEYLLTIA